MNQIGQTVGANAAQFVHQLLQNAAQPGRSITASAIGLVTVLLGAMRIFGQLKEMLNRIWRVKVNESAVKGFFKRYLLSFLMVLGVGVLLFAMIVATTVLSAATRYLGAQMGHSALLWQIANTVVSLLIFTLLFAMIYRVLPDRHIPWGDVWIGSAVTSVLFTIGKYLIGFYLARGTIASPYGAAGSLVILLVFIDYSALILFFGAEFTEVYSRLYGSCCPERAGEPRPESQGAPPAAGPRPVGHAAGGRPMLRGGLMMLGVGLLFFVRRVFRGGEKT